MEKTNLRILEIELVRTKSDTVRARVDVHFDGFWLKGFKIIRGKEGRSDYVTPPSYKSSKGWRGLFKTDNPEDWQEIQRRILEEFNRSQMEKAADEAYEEMGI